MKPTLKYARFEGNKIIIVPTTVGKKYLENRGLEEGIDTVGGQEVKALTKTFSGNLKNFTVEMTPSKNVNRIFAFSSTEEQISIGFPHYAEEEKKQ
jgi:hypothetical protein